MKTKNSSKGLLPWHLRLVPYHGYFSRTNYRWANVKFDCIDDSMCHPPTTFWRDEDQCLAEPNTLPSKMGDATALPSGINAAKNFPSQAPTNQNTTSPSNSAFPTQSAISTPLFSEITGTSSPATSSPRRHWKKSKLKFCDPQASTRFRSIDCSNCGSIGYISVASFIGEFKRGTNCNAVDFDVPSAARPLHDEDGRCQSADPWWISTGHRFLLSSVYSIGVVVALDLGGHLLGRRGDTKMANISDGLRSNIMHELSVSTLPDELMVYGDAGFSTDSGS
jgi:hypothetical protein